MTTGIDPPGGLTHAESYNLGEHITRTETTEERHRDDEEPMCDVSGCKKRAVADLVSEEDGLRCVDCLEWWLRENEW